MSIPTTLVDHAFESLVHHVDERWTMAYAAGLGLDDDAYLNTARPGGVVAHPLFSVCPEWPVIVGSRTGSKSLGVTQDEVQTGVHATHDVTVHRLIRPGDVLTTSIKIVAVENKRPGARSTTLLTTTDADGLPVATTRQDAIYLGVPAEGEDRPDANPPPPLKGMERRGDPVELPIDLAAGAAHVYTECARIWNPIHTDPVVARSAGLPGIILHGTANLAHGVSAVVSRAAQQRPELVRRIRGRFAAMVPLPSTIIVAVWPENDNGDGTRTVPFEVRNAAGALAVADGAVVLGELD